MASSSEVRHRFTEPVPPTRTALDQGVVSCVHVGEEVEVVVEQIHLEHRFVDRHRRRRERPAPHDLTLLGRPVDVARPMGEAVAVMPGVVAMAQASLSCATA